MGTAASIYSDYPRSKFRNHEEALQYIDKECSACPPNIFNAKHSYKKLYTILFHYHQFNDKCEVFQQIKKIVESGISLNSRNEIGWTALHYATITNDPKIFQYLLKKGADTSAITWKRFSDWDMKDNNSIRDLVLFFKSDQLEPFVD